jgi:hypothetical protein
MPNSPPINKRQSNWFSLLSLSRLMDRIMHGAEGMKMRQTTAYLLETQSNKKDSGRQKGERGLSVMPL